MNLMPRDEVAALLDIDPNSVRNILRRYGITEQRGYPREAVEELARTYVPRAGQGRRTDLHPKEEPMATEWCNCQDPTTWHPAGDTPSCPAPSSD